MLAGILIGISAYAYLKTNNPFIFAFGLLAIKTLNLKLFTGEICKTNKNMFKNLIGNIIGSVIIGIICTDIDLPNRLDKPWYLLIILGILCNICIYIAVKGDTVTTVLAVAIFVSCGFEHCIADVFYMFISNHISWKIIFVITGNLIGGIVMREYFNRKLEIIKIIKDRCKN